MQENLLWRPNATLSQASQPAPWPIELKNLLIRAMFVVGTESNVILVRETGTSKTPHQVGGTKLRIFSKYPDWKSFYLNPVTNEQATPLRTESQKEEQTGKPNTIIITYYIPYRSHWIVPSASCTIKEKI